VKKIFYVDFYPTWAINVESADRNFTCKVWLSIAGCQEIHFTQKFIRIARKM